MALFCGVYFTVVSDADWGWGACCRQGRQSRTQSELPVSISKHRTGRNSKRTGRGAGLVLSIGLSLLKCVYTHRRAREHFRLTAPFELWRMVTSGLVGPLLVLGVAARPTRARPAVSSSLKSTPWMAALGALNDERK